MSSRKSRFIDQLQRYNVPSSAKQVELKRNLEDSEVAGSMKNKEKDDDKDLFSDSDGDGDGDNVADGPSSFLKIRKISSSKDKIHNPKLSEQDVIPRLGTSCIMNGTTGQGKSTLLTNLISSKRFFGGKLPKTGKRVFAHKFLVSPTAEGDDVQKKLGIEDDDTFTDLHEAPELLGVIMSSQKKKVKKLGSDNAPQVLLIYDDVISHPDFMRSDEFIKSFIASRHYNLTTFICSQSWTAVPRKCRLQAKNIFFFASPLSEVEMLCQEYCPPNMTKKQFFKMVDYCTSEPYSFLYINKSVPMEKRFRRRLGEVINLKFFQSLDITRENELKANNNSLATDSQDQQQQQPQQQQYQQLQVKKETPGLAGESGRSSRKRKANETVVQTPP